MFEEINDQVTVNQKTVCEVLLMIWITTTLTMFSRRMKQILIFVPMSILKTVATGQVRNLSILTRKPYIRRRLFGVL